jgi:hypothetical protein
MTEALMVTLPVVVLDVFMQDQSERLLADKPESVQAAWSKNSNPPVKPHYAASR